MGWQEREWAKWTDEERRRFYGGGSTGPYATSTPPTARSRQYPNVGYSRRMPHTRRGFGIREGAGVAIVASAILFALGHFPSGNPILPIPKIPLRSAGQAVTPHAPARLDLDSTTVYVGTGVTIYGGGLIAYEGRPVTLEGSYDGRVWQQLAATTVQAGHWQLHARYPRPGRLQLRLRYPNGDVAGAVVTVEARGAAPPV